MNITICMEITWEYFNFWVQEITLYFSISLCVETNSVMLVMQFKHMAFPALLNNPFTIINAWRCVKRLAPGLKLLAELFVG